MVEGGISVRTHSSLEKPGAFRSSKKLLVDSGSRARKPEHRAKSSVKKIQGMLISVLNTYWSIADSLQLGLTIGFLLSFVSGLCTKI